MESNYVVIPFTYKAKDGQSKSLTLFIPKTVDKQIYQLQKGNFFGISLKDLIEDREDG